MKKVRNTIVAALFLALSLAGILSLVPSSAQVYEIASEAEYLCTIPGESPGHTTY